MIDFHIGKENVGKIAERIVANELEAHGFLVRDLNLEGISANADLLAIKDQHVWQVQVKGATYNEDYPNNGWWFQYGYCKDEHINDPNARMFNRAKGAFKASIVAMVCVRSPFEYQYVILQVEAAEEAAQINLNYAYRPPKQNGGAHKPGKVWFTFFETNSRTDTVRDGIKNEQHLLRPFLIDRSRKDDSEQREQTKAIVSGVIARTILAQKTLES